MSSALCIYLQFFALLVFVSPVIACVLRQRDHYGTSSPTANQFAAVSERVCVYAAGKKEEIDQHREKRVHRQMLDGGCERVRGRGRGRARAVAADSCCSSSLWAKQLQTGSNS